MTPTLDAARAIVRRKLLRAFRALGVTDAPRPAFDGGLLRPVVAYALASPAALRSDALWSAALAIQLAHEASLVHDDIIDNALVRRGQASTHDRLGVAAALALGDHYLTLAYRAAAATRSLAFIGRFASAVERTVAGERAQGTVAGLRLDWPQYREIVLGKSGELIGCAGEAVATIDDTVDGAELDDLGRRVGLLYQMFDDLLDYCPTASTGKPALGDFRQRRWTWVLEHVPDLEFGAADDVVHRALFSGGPWSAAGAALARFDAERVVVQESVRARGGRAHVLASLIEGWGRAAHEAVEREVQTATPAAASRATPTPPAPHEWPSYFARNGRSFRFASGMLPTSERDRIARVYSFCRFTDDLVDAPAQSTQPLMARLDAWIECARVAYEGGVTRIPLLDTTMREMARANVSFAHIEELVEGMRMDVHGLRYEDVDDLRRYTYRVASTVGLWLTELHGVRDRWMLDRAAALGHAMQLTNIVRDVGEDLARGRVYLPMELMHSHEVTVGDLHAMQAGASLTDGYRALIDDMSRLARSEYALAREAIPYLPVAFGRSVAIASAIYGEILDDVALHGYDNLTRRAHTSFGRKLVVGGLALLALRAQRATIATPSLRLARG